MTSLHDAIDGGVPKPHDEPRDQPYDEPATIPSTRRSGSSALHLRGVGRAFVVVCTIAWFLFAAVVIVLRYLVLPHVDDYRPDIERIASRALGETVRIAQIDASWRGLRPSLTLRSLKIAETRDGRPGANVLELPSVSATLSWDSLLLFELRLASLEVDAPQLTVRRDAAGQLFVAGFPIRKKATPDNRVGEWLLAQNEIRIRHARIVWQDEMPREGDGDGDGTAPARAPADIVLSDVDLAVVRSGWRHRIALRAAPPAELAAPIDVRAVIDHSLFASRFAEPDDWQGELYVDAASGDLTAWRAVVPLPATVEAGRGRARAWMQFTKASAPAGLFVHQLAERTKRPLPPALDRIASVTADLALDDVAVRWGDGANRDYAALASIDGRITTSQSPTEQRFAALHMALQPRRGHTVPATDFHIERTIGASVDDESGRASLGAIDIGVSAGLLPDAFVPPVIIEKIATLKPSGKLDAMTVEWTGSIVAPKTFKIDARFEQLSMAAQPPSTEAIAIASHDVVLPDGTTRKRHPPFGRPGFENLRGTLSAIRSNAANGATGPTTRLALDLRGADSTITAPGLFDDPVLHLTHLEAQVGVVVDAGDIEVRIERGSFDNAELAGTVALTFRHGPHSGGTGSDDPTDGGRGWIDLDARLSRADLARVPRYLPNIIGPKARAYLSKSLLGGKVSEASFRMHGALEHLDLRAMPGATATPYATPIASALVAIRDAPATRGDRGPKVSDPSDPSPDQAIFRAVVKVQGATFLYGPARDPDPRVGVSTATGQPVLPSIAWPVFEDLDADIVFEQAHMTVYGHSTRVYGYRLTDVTAELPALADPAHVLRVTGRGSGPLQDLVRFINNSPVSQWTKRFTETSQGNGNALFALALDLPLTHPRDAEVAGSLQFLGDDLAINASIPPLKSINGRLDFTDRGMAINGMTAQTLGGPLRVDASTGRDGYIELNAEGAIDIAALKANVHEGASTAATATPIANVVDRASQWLSGGARYTVGVRVRNKRVADLAAEAQTTADSSRSTAASTAAARGAPTAAEDGDPKPDILVRSDLVGLASSLPAPLTKTAADSWPLRIAITRKAGATATESEDLRITLANQIDADIVRHRNAQGQLAVSRAAYRIGNGDDRATTDGPSVVRIALPKLDLDAWRDVVRQIGNGPRASAEPANTAVATSGLDNLLPGEASLMTPLLHAAGRDFDNVAIDARRLSSGWQADVVADQVAGRLSYTDVSGSTAARNGVAPVSSGRVVARLSRLTIPRSEASDGQTENRLDASRQKDFPAIDLIADRFELRGRSLGRLEVIAKNVGDGDDRAWQLEKLGLTTPEAHFAAQGTWGHRAGAENTHLDFDLQASDVGALMDRFGLTRTIKSGTAHLTGDIGWNGGPTTIDFGSMEGKLQLAADKGQFLKADPGIAKLLNILSLQGLARRLTLDFDDVFDAGFAFDTVRADATVTRGIASTSDFTMRGVQATVTMSGTADLERETTDLHVLVAPQINAGAASLGVAVINPVIGLATFAAQYLFKDRISQALSFEYNVVGPWVKPEVTKIDRNGKATPVVPKATAAARDGPAPSNRAQ